jgi:hypothetical protein
MSHEFSPEHRRIATGEAEMATWYMAKNGCPADALHPS